MHRTVPYVSVATHQLGLSDDAGASTTLSKDSIAAASAREKVRHCCINPSVNNTTYIALIQAFAGGLVIYRIAVCMPHMTTELY